MNKLIAECWRVLTDSFKSNSFGIYIHHLRKIQLFLAEDIQWSLIDGIRWQHFHASVKCEAISRIRNMEHSTAVTGQAETVRADVDCYTGVSFHHLLIYRGVESSLVWMEETDELLLNDRPKGVLLSVLHYRDKEIESKRGLHWLKVTWPEHTGAGIQMRKMAPEPYLPLNN